MIRLVILCTATMLVAIGLGACSPLRAIDILTPTSTYQLTPGEAYGGDPRQRLDVYLPSNAHTPAPVVVFFYGGGWDTGARSQYRFVGEALAEKGIVTVIADYRLSPAYKYPVFVQDSAAAVAWTKSHIAAFGGDPQQIFVMGHSAGAYNAAMVALDPRWLKEVGLTPAAIKGWIGLAGPYDFLPIVDEDVKIAFDFPGTPPDSQPIAHATKLSPPALLMAGSADDVVDHQRSTVHLARLLQEQGVTVELEIVQGVGHAMMVGAFAKLLRGRAPVLDRVSSFVKREP